MLKQLIQRLLDSRTTPAQAAHNASSTYTEPTWFNGTPTVGNSWTYNLYTGTAPTDGFLNVSGSANINTANTGAMIQAKISGAQISQVSPMAGQGFNMMAPISKGATFSVNGIRLSDITVRFFKTIGGGYNLFVRRALSCLRPSFNYLPRSFCKAKNLGFQNNQLLLSIRALIFLAQAPRISLPTPHRATAGRLLDATQIQSQLLKSKSRTGRWHLLPFLTETLRELESVVTLKKGHRLSSCVVAGVQPIILFGSTRQVQTFNPLTGGALC